MSSTALPDSELHRAIANNPCTNDVTSTSYSLVDIVLDLSADQQGNVGEDVISLLNTIPSFSHIHWRIMPLLFEAIVQSRLSDRIDPQVMALLAQKSLQGSVHELLKSKQLNTLLTLLAEHDIPVILLKGTAFSKWLYTEGVPRLSSDLDILVQPHDWNKTVDLLARTMSREAKPVQGVFDDLYELSFKPKGEQLGVEIDLHKYLTHPTLFDVDLEGMWSRSVPHPAHKSELIRMMSVPDALIHQALHCFKDAEYKTYNLIDTAYLLKQEFTQQRTVQWDNVFALAKEQRADVALYGLLSKLAAATQDDALTAYLVQYNISRLRKCAFEHLSSMHVTSHDVLNKTWRYRLLQFGFHAIVSTKPLSMLKLQWLFMKCMLRKSKYKRSV